MTWEDYYHLAENYYRRHGDLAMPSTYWVQGVNLGAWISRQRVCHQPGAVHPLTLRQVELLDALNMDWEIRRRDWEVSFGCAEKYYKEHGNLSVPKHYEVDGVNLSHWIWAQRRIVNGTTGENSRKLTEEQIRRLEEIGMEWAPKSKGFSYFYGLAKQYYKVYGNTDFPKGKIVLPGVHASEKGAAVTGENDSRQKAFVSGDALKGESDLPDEGASQEKDAEGIILPESGETLAAWKKEQESENFFEKNGGRAWERQKLLREIGIEPKQKGTVWDRKYCAAEAYYREHGNLLVPFSYVTEDGIQLGKWISNQRIKRRGTWGAPPTEEQIRKLDAIGMSWDEAENRGRRKNVAKKPKESACGGDGDIS